MVGVALCTAEDDVLLTTAAAAAPSASRPTTCACSRAGIRPACAASACRGDDEVISMAVLRPRRRHAGRARRLRQTRQRHAPGDRRGRRRRRAVVEADDEAERRGDDAALSRRTHRRTGRGRAVHPDRHRDRLRQALLGLRVPPHRSRRAGADGPRPGRSRAARAWPPPSRSRTATTCCWSPRRPDDPHAGRPGPHRRPLQPGRDHLPHRRGREGRLGRTPGRSRGERRRGRRRGRLDDGADGEARRG